MKKYQWIIAAIAVPSVGITAYVLLTSPSSRWKLPLDPDVVGDVSNWIMVAVTAVTAWVFWKTLESQKEVQRAQMYMLSLAESERRSRIQPRFDVEGTSTALVTRINRAGHPDKLSFDFKLTQVGSDAFNVNYRLTFSDGEKSLREKSEHIGKVDSNRPINVKDNEAVVPFQPGRDFSQYSVRVDFTFDDADGNTYEQYVKYKYKGTLWIGNPGPVGLIKKAARSV